MTAYTERVFCYGFCYGLLSFSGNHSYGFIIVNNYVTA